MEDITESGKPLVDADNVMPVRFKDGVMIVEIFSGDYQFKSKIK